MSTSPDRRSVSGIAGLALLATAGTLTIVSAGAGVLAAAPAATRQGSVARGSLWGTAPLVVPGVETPRTHGALERHPAHQPRAAVRSVSIAPDRLVPLTRPPLAVPPVVLPPLTVPPITVPPIAVPPGGVPSVTIGKPAHPNLARHEARTLDALDHHSAKASRRGTAAVTPAGRAHDSSARQTAKATKRLAKVSRAKGKKNAHPGPSGGAKRQHAQRSNRCR